MQNVNVRPTKLSYRPGKKYVIHISTDRYSPSRRSVRKIVNTTELRATLRTVPQKYRKDCNETHFYCTNTVLQKQWQF